MYLQRWLDKHWHPINNNKHTSIYTTMYRKLAYTHSHIITFPIAPSPNLMEIYNLEYILVNCKVAWNRGYKNNSKEQQMCNFSRIQHTAKRFIGAIFTVPGDVTDHGSRHTLAGGALELAIVTGRHNGHEHEHWGKNQITCTALMTINDLSDWKTLKSQAHTQKKAP